jgi:hypothetical protein
VLHARRHIRGVVPVEGHLRLLHRPSLRHMAGVAAGMPGRQTGPPASGAAPTLPPHDAAWTFIACLALCSTGSTLPRGC